MVLLKKFFKSSAGMLLATTDQKRFLRHLRGYQHVTVFTKNNQGRKAGYLSL